MYMQQYLGNTVEAYIRKFAFYPGSTVGVEKIEAGTHCLHMHQLNLGPWKLHYYNDIITTILLGRNSLDTAGTRILQTAG